MKKSTFKDYIRGIRGKYEVAKEGNYACFLAKPSPALLHDYCKVLQQQELSKKDQDILEVFYKQPNFDNDKFRPICNFFKGKTENPSHDILDMMALLVDFRPRPLGEFLKNNGGNIEREVKRNVFQEESKEFVIAKFLAPELNNSKTLIWNKKTAVLLFVIVGLSAFVYWNYFSTKACMQWNGQEYVETNCDNETVGFGNFRYIVPYDEQLMHFKKISPTDTTTYFKDGKAIVWYCKKDADHLELFNAPGHHPVTKQPLRAITRHMILKYLKK